MKLRDCLEHVAFSLREDTSDSISRIKEYIIQTSEDKDAYYFVDEIIQEIVETKPDKKQNFLDRLAPSFLDLILSGDDRSIELRCKIGKTLNTLFKATPKHVKLDFFEKNSIALNQLSKLLMTIGDFEVQLTLIELLYRVTVGHSGLSLRLFDWQPNLCPLFVSITREDFEVDARAFLNNLNRSCGKDARVWTYACIKAEVGDQKVFKPSEENYEEFYVDFNEGTRSILIFCQRADGVEGSWNGMTVYDHDIETISVIEHEYDQVLDLTLGREAHLLFDSASLDDFPGKSARITFPRNVPIFPCVSKVFTGRKVNIIKFKKIGERMSIPVQRLKLFSEAVPTSNEKITTDLDRFDVVNRERPRDFQAIENNLISVTLTEDQPENLKLAEQVEKPKPEAHVKVTSQQTRNKLTTPNLPDLALHPESVTQTAPTHTVNRMPSDRDDSSEDESFVFEGKGRKKKVVKTKKKKKTKVTTSSSEMSSEESLIESKKSRKPFVIKKLKKKSLTTETKNPRSTKNLDISSYFGTDQTKSNNLSLDGVALVVIDTNDFMVKGDSENIPPSSCGDEKGPTRKEKVSLNFIESVSLQNNVDICENNDDRSDDDDWLNRLEQKKKKMGVGKNDPAVKTKSVAPQLKMPAKSRVDAGKKKVEAVHKQMKNVRTKKSDELPKKAIDDSKKKSVFSLFNLDDDEDDDEDWIAFRERQKMRDFMRQNRGTTGRPNIQSKPVGPTSDVNKSDLIGKKQKIDQSSAVTEVCSTLRQVVSKGLSKKVAPAVNDTSKHKAEVVGTMPPEASKSTDQVSPDITPNTRCYRTPPLRRVTNTEPAKRGRRNGSLIRSVADSDQSPPLKRNRKSDEFFFQDSSIENEDVATPLLDATGRPLTLLSAARKLNFEDKVSRIDIQPSFSELQESEITQMGDASLKSSHFQSKAELIRRVETFRHLDLGISSYKDHAEICDKLGSEIQREVDILRSTIGHDINEMLFKQEISVLDNILKMETVRRNSIHEHIIAFESRLQSGTMDLIRQFEKKFLGTIFHRVH